MMTKLQFDKVSWTSVKFGDVVSEVRNTVKSGEKENIERYIGLEHIDSENIHITKWGYVKNGTTFTRKFDEGQILFGRRRAYLKKAGLATFTGLCSGDIIVMEAKEKLLPELLPFLINNNHFFDFAVDTSAGSLSPRTKFKHLAEYQFLLPPKDQQAKIAELLWAMDDVVEKEKDVLEEIQSAYQVILEKIFSESDIFKLHKLKELATVNEESLKSSNDSDYEFKYLDIASIVEPKIIGEMKKMKFSDAPSRARRKLKDGSIVLSLVRPYHKAFVLVEKSKNIISSTGTAVINANGVVNNHFLFHQFFSNRFQLFCAAMMTGTNYPAITPSDLKEYKLYFCESIEEQNKIASKLNSFDNSVVYLKESIQQSKQLQKSLINEIFSE